MRWNDLFADLEGQLGAAADAQFASDVADRTRGERASVALESRLGASIGAPVVVSLCDGERTSGTLNDVAATWIVVTERARQSWIPMHAIVAVTGLADRAVGLSVVSRRLSMGHALRALSRDRADVVVSTSVAQWRGLIAQAGADYIDVRDGERGAVTSIPLHAIVKVSSIGDAM